MLTRAYSLLTVKSINEDQRTIEGIATTPEPDRMADVVETSGIKYKLPMPFLLQHNSRQPIGKVVSAKVTKDGMVIKAQVAPAGTAGFIDESWALIKAGLIPGLSIGFRSLEESYDRETGGYHFIRTELYEISAVTIPANGDCSILSVKSADSAALAALGDRRSGVVKLDKNLPGDSGPTRPKGKTMTIKEQIASFEAKRAASAARMEAIMKDAGDAGVTLDETQTEEYDGLQAEVESIDRHLVRLKAHEKTLAANALAVTDSNTRGTEASSESRGSSRIISVTSMKPKGIGIARMAIAMVRSNNNAMVAADMARKYWPDSPEVELALKTAVEAGDTTTSGWASQLVPAAQQMNDDFLELLRPATIIGRIPGLRRVPFNIAIPIETASGTASWVGEGAAKPVSKLTLSSVTLRWAKAAAIVVITKELAKFSRPDAELVVRNSMVKTLVRFLDTTFVSANAEVTNVSPAGILNGISSTATSGTTAAAFRTDMTTLLKKLTANNVPLSSVVLIMSSSQAVALSLMVTDLGVGLFPNITREGGTILGFPVIVSEAVGTKIIAINADEILLAEDPGVMVDVSDTASVEMDTEPIQGETSPVTNMVALKSFWQNNLIGVRVEQFITFKAARASAVEYLTGTAYTS